MSTQLPFTVIAFDSSTGHLVSMKVLADEAFHAFAVAANTRPASDYGFIAALNGHQDESSSFTFPGEGVVYTQTVLEQADVFGTPESGAAEASAKLAFIHVKALQPEIRLAFEDKTIAGIYCLEISSDIDDVNIANAALDGFHDRVPIKVLDDFEIVVRSGPEADAPSIPEGDNQEQGIHADAVISIDLMPMPAKKSRMKP